MENSAPDRQQVRVTILSRPYTLLTSGDSHEVEEVAAISAATASAGNAIRQVMFTLPSLR